MEWLQSANTKLQQFWKSHGHTIFLALSFLLVGVLCFEAGLLQKSLGHNDSIIIHTSEPLNTISDSPASLTPLAVPLETSTGSLSQTPSNETVCLFVGSKKSNKYHNPTSRCAKQIKPENKRCFTSVETAKQAGYLPGCLTP